MRKQYESMFVLTPVLSEEQVKNSIEKIKKAIVEHKGEVLHEEYWGMRQLAYPIAHKKMGFYYLLEFLIDASAITALRTEYNRDERLVRHMTIALDKHAVDYNEKRRQKIAATKKEEAEKAALASTEGAKSTESTASAENTADTAKAEKTAKAEDHSS